MWKMCSTRETERVHVPSSAIDQASDWTGTTTDNVDSTSPWFYTELLPSYRSGQDTSECFVESSVKHEDSLGTEADGFGI